MKVIFFCHLLQIGTVQSGLLHDVVVERIERVFQCHGAVRINTPLLMPRPPQYAGLERTLPCFLDKSGCVVNLPVDLRVPFARYVAQNNVTNIKRFSVERVYKQNKALNLHPREYVECAFDIVTTAKDCLLPDAELLIVVKQVINAFPVLQVMMTNNCQPAQVIAQSHLCICRKNQKMCDFWGFLQLVLKCNCSHFGKIFVLRFFIL
jgi:histidyl-tRNA synthetase